MHACGLALNQDSYAQPNPQFGLGSRPRATLSSRSPLDQNQAPTTYATKHRKLSINIKVDVAIAFPSNLKGACCSTSGVT
jgi:hypothetical protein